MLPRSNARRTAKPENTKKGCTQITMSTAFFAFITFYISMLIAFITIYNRMHIAFITIYNRMHIAFLLLRLHHIAARVNAQEDEQQDGEAP